MSSNHAPNPPSQPKEPTDSEISDPPSKRSRSQSRRARRRKAQQQKSQQESKQQMPPVNEDVNEEEKEEGSSSSPSAKPGATPQSLQRGEIPIRGGKPGSKQETTKTKEDGGGESDEMMKQDGLKLRLELNLDIELELKASIRGDITLALLA